ncbi:integrase arm-type DNA-binding domain-containing protein [Geobacter pelophilus]|uniref:Integrase arm-type DNA-binding domain-containing protein n=1 Tax=Geoanaerobacter pelophilus TaxID=60036 RepID=A0AAW4L7S0_9BACT|nr:integrase arm-type DNA-binding domain-containing protein [Geoanaerobacter pelophilus]MBT0664341.1 integrase arm-type DNA-binding domain-containing protein [Geoanaerobacter pelophilus]
MPKRIIPLTDMQVQKVKPNAKEIKLGDGDGLYLLVSPSGGKLWRFDYRYLDRRKTLSIGPYPAISLAKARQLRDDARRLLLDGTDPGTVHSKRAKAEKLKESHAAEQRQADYAANTFEKVAREWHSSRVSEWSATHADRLMRQLERDVFPEIGSRHIAEVTFTDIVALLRKVSIRTLETAHRLKIAFHGTFRYAMMHGLITHNPATDFREVLPTVKPKHMAAPTDPKKAAELLRAIDSFSGSFIVKCAMQLAPLLFCRPGELRHAEWSEIDLERALWSIPAEKMKLKKPHLVPLSNQAIVIFKALQTLTGSGRYVFPCHRSPLRCMSENSVNAGLRRLGFEKEEITGHGFRAMARTMLHEILQFQPDVIEAQLAHAVPDRLGNAYNRTQFIKERTAMMQTWADYLDGLKTGAKVIPLKKAN